MRELSDRDVAEFRERIGDAAATLYAKGGEAAVSMREIARAVGASPMGLYRYFDDRAAHADGCDGTCDRVTAVACERRSRHEAERALGNGRRDIAAAARRIIDELVDRHARIGADGEDGLIDKKNLQRALVAADDDIADMDRSANHRWMKRGIGSGWFCADFGSERH